MASYEPRASPSESPARCSRPRLRQAHGWNWDGGTPIIGAEGRHHRRPGRALRRAGLRDRRGQQHSERHGAEARPAAGHPEIRGDRLDHAAHVSSTCRIRRRRRLRSRRPRPAASQLCARRRARRDADGAVAQVPQAARPRSPRANNIAPQHDGEGRRPHRHSGRLARRLRPRRQRRSRRRPQPPKTAPAQKVASIPATAPVAAPSAAMVTPAAHEPEPPKTKTDVTAGDAELPLAGERPRHRGVRPEAERRSRTTASTSRCRKARRSRRPRTASSPMPATS